MSYTSIENIQIVSGIVLASSIALAALAPIAISYTKASSDKSDSNLDSAQFNYDRIKYLLIVLFVSVVLSSISSFMFLFGSYFSSTIYYILLATSFSSLLLLIVGVSIFIHIMLNMLHE